MGGGSVCLMRSEIHGISSCRRLRVMSTIGGVGHCPSFRGFRGGYNVHMLADVCPIACS